MRRVFVQIVDTKTGGYQFEMIQEPVKNGMEVLNALKHFGIGDVNWTNTNANDLWETKFGIVEGTSKIITLIII
jgi:hypothetical protein